MRTIKAYRVEQEFRRQRNHGQKFGDLVIHWDRNAPPYMDGLLFKAGDVLIVYESESTPARETYVHHRAGKISTSATVIMAKDVQDLIAQRLVRELA